MLSPVLFSIFTSDQADGAEYTLSNFAYSTNLGEATDTPGSCAAIQREGTSISPTGEGRRVPSPAFRRAILDRYR